MNIFNKFFKKKKVEKTAFEFDVETYEEVMDLLGIPTKDLAIRKTVIVFEVKKAAMVYIDAFARIDKK